MANPFKAKQANTIILARKPNKKQIAEVTARISSLFHVIIGSTNDITHGTMIDAQQQIRKAGLLRHAVKKACKDAMQRYEVFDIANMKDMVHETEDKRKIYMDFLDSVQERMKEPLYNFRKSIARELFRRNIPDRQLKSYVILSEAMLVYAVELFDKFVEACPPCDPIDWRETFLKARLEPTLKAWQTITDIICKDCIDIKIDQAEECKACFSKIEDELVSEQNIFKSTTEALDLNPEQHLRVDKGYVQLLKDQHKRITLTPFQEEYLVDNYNTMPKDKLAQALGISTATLHKFAKELNVCADLNQDKTRGEAYVEYEVEPNN